MSCNAIELKTSEILNSTFRSRVFELTIPVDNRNPDNDVFTAKVKIKGTEILEIPGNIVGNRVIFQLTELEDTNKFTDYEIDYWANLDVLGKELFAQEQLRVASKVQPDRCTPDVVAGTLNFGDVVVQAQVTMPVLVLEQHTNNYLDYDSLTPEQKEELTGPPGDEGPTGREGLGIFYTSQQISGTSGSTAISNINKPDGRNVKVGDLIISTNALSSGRLNIVSSLTATHANNSFLVNLRGIEGLSMYSANIAFDAVSGTLTKSEVNVPSGYSLKTADLVISTHPDTLLRLVRITSMTSTTANYTTVIENAITVEGETIEVGKNLTKVGNVVDVKLQDEVYKSEILGLTGSLPQDIATDSERNVYITNYNSNSITKITPEGVSSILASVNYPKGIAIDSEDNIYVTSYNLNIVTKITPSGASSVLGNTGDKPERIVVDAEGNVYTVNLGSANVTKITPSGVSSILAGIDSFSLSIAIDSEGNIYTASSTLNRVTKITPSGNTSILGVTGNAPQDIAVDAEGNVYTSNRSSSNVTKITPSGVSSTLATTVAAPAGIVVDAEGNVYISNRVPAVVTKITPSGNSSIIGNTGNDPSDIAIDSEGNLYTVNHAGYSVSRISKLKQRKLGLNFEGEIIRVGSYSLTEMFTGDVWINGKEVFRKVIVDGDAHPADIDTLIREQTVGGHVILEYTKN